MKFLIVLLLIFSSLSNAGEVVKKQKTLSVQAKKKRFYSTVVPIIDKVYNQRYELYNKIKKDINNTQNSQIQELKEYYRVKTDHELMMALKPQPKSIAIAQAAMESAWGTSSFFNTANNLFGMWSISKKENRVAASKKRDNNTTVWVKKYNSLEDSVKGYYITLAKGKKYKKLRELNYADSNVYEIIQGLDKYSERGEEYVNEIESIIRYNKLTKYDEKENN
ncbi:MAG: glucosaminidase domain-containing protein [Campylobacterales bacterium]|nr:glucosaminidase domain-containing protein [Campylobacterales bacterium]